MMQPIPLCIRRTTNPSVYLINGQDLYTGDTQVISKNLYKIDWVIDENGDVNYSF